MADRITGLPPGGVPKTVSVNESHSGPSASVGEPATFFTPSSRLTGCEIDGEATDTCKSESFPFAIVSPSTLGPASPDSWVSNSPPRTATPEAWRCIHKHVHREVRPPTVLRTPPIWCPSCPICTSPDRPDPLSLQDRQNERKKLAECLDELKEAQPRMRQADYIRAVNALHQRFGRLRNEGRPGPGIPTRYGRTVAYGSRAQPSAFLQQGGTILQRLGPIDDAAAIPPPPTTMLSAPVHRRSDKNICAVDTPSELALLHRSQ